MKTVLLKVHALRLTSCTTSFSFWKDYERTPFSYRLIGVVWKL